MLTTAKNKLNEGTARLAAAITVGAVAIADRRRIQVAMIVPMAMLMTSSVALAASCDPRATTKLTTLIASAAKFMMAIGGALALLCFVVGGVLIMIGGTSERVAKGKKLITNTVIGLAIMAGGFFIKEVLLSFVGGATSNNSGGDTKCLDDGNSQFQ